MKVGARISAVGLGAATALPFKRNLLDGISFDGLSGVTNLLSKPVGISAVVLAAISTLRGKQLNELQVGGV